VSRAGLLLGALVLAALAAGCGGASVDRNPETPADWAQSVCLVFTDWRDRVRGIGEELAEGDDLSTDSLRDAGDKLETANERLVRQLRRIDAPDSGSIGDAQDAIRQLSEDVDEREGEVEDALAAVGRELSAATVFDAISIVAGALRDTARDVRETLEELERAGGDAVEALQESAACQDLAGDAPAGS
jgi:hypothetical protein